VHQRAERAVVPEHGGERRDPLDGRLHRRGLLVATGAVLFFTGSSEKNGAIGFVVGPTIGPEHAGVVVQGVFR
jgi:hypothetical protein